MTASATVRRAGAAGAIALAASLVLVQPAFASANVEGLLQNVVDMLTGNTARLLAVLAVVVVGILWMFGLFDLAAGGDRRARHRRGLRRGRDRQPDHWRCVMEATLPWLAVASAAIVLALCLMLGLKLMSPTRFAQILAGLASGLALALTLSRLSAGGHHG